jgi:hypothetical protein
VVLDRLSGRDPHTGYRLATAYRALAAAVELTASAQSRGDREGV